MDESCLPFYHACDENILSQHQSIGKQLQFVLSHASLDSLAKLLWMWMLHHSMYDPNHCCWFSYHQLSKAMNQDVNKIHASLICLHTMGFLKTNLPAFPLFQQINLHQSVQQRTFQPVLPQYAWDHYKQNAETLISEKLVFLDKNARYQRPQAFIDLMAKYKNPLPCYDYEHSLKDCCIANFFNLCQK